MMHFEIAVPMSDAVLTVIGYQNWKGIFRKREIIPLLIFFGDSPYHEGTQFFMRAIDNEEPNVIKDFAMKDISSYEKL